MATKSANYNTLDLLRVLNESIVALGLNKVVTFLSWINKINKVADRDISDIIIYSVCQKYNMTPHELIHSDRNDGERSDAICIMAALLKKHALMSQNDIAVKLNRHKSQISKYISRMSKLNVHLFKLDRKLYEDFKEISESIEQIIYIDHNTWKQNEAEEDQESQAQ